MTSLFRAGFFDAHAYRTEDYDGVKDFAHRLECRQHDGCLVNRNTFISEGNCPRFTAGVLLSFAGIASRPTQASQMR